MSIYSTDSAMWDVFLKGYDKLLDMNPSPELVDACEAIRRALNQDYFSWIADSIVSTWDYYYDQLYEQERENFGYHLVDPLLDILR
jgi:hypothetical protein